MSLRFERHAWKKLTAVKKAIIAEKRDGIAISDTIAPAMPTTIKIKISVSGSVIRS